MATNISFTGGGFPFIGMSNGKELGHYHAFMTLDVDGQSIIVFTPLSNLNDPSNATITASFFTRVEDKPGYVVLSSIDDPTLQTEVLMATQRISQHLSGNFAAEEQEEEALTFTSVDENGDEIEFSVLGIIEFKGRNIIIYTSGETDEEGALVIGASYMNESDENGEENQFEVEEIDDPEAHEVVGRFLEDYFS